MELRERRKHSRQKNSEEGANEGDLRHEQCGFSFKHMSYLVVSDRRVLSVLLSLLEVNAFRALSLLEYIQKHRINTFGELKSFHIIFPYFSIVINLVSCSGNVWAGSQRAYTSKFADIT
jgi:hypothetical protein